ncbi:hypothetical protein, partial [Burkholderia sp. 3C]
MAEIQHISRRHAQRVVARAGDVDHLDTAELVGRATVQRRNVEHLIRARQLQRVDARTAMRPRANARKIADIGHGEHRVRAAAVARDRAGERLL